MNDNSTTCFVIGSGMFVVSAFASIGSYFSNQKLKYLEKCQELKSLDSIGNYWTRGSLESPCPITLDVLDSKYNFLILQTNQYQIEKVCTISTSTNIQNNLGGVDIETSKPKYTKNKIFYKSIWDYSNVIKMNDINVDNICHLFPLEYIKTVITPQSFNAPPSKGIRVDTLVKKNDNSLNINTDFQTRFIESYKSCFYGLRMDGSKFTIIGFYNGTFTKDSIVTRQLFNDYKLDVAKEYKKNYITAAITGLAGASFYVLGGLIILMK